MDYGQKLATMVGILLAIVMLCTGSGALSYIYGKGKGYHAGYEVGQETSYSQGYSQGKDEGYRIGYKAGSESNLGDSTSIGYDLINPSYQEMKAFLAQDITNSKTYIKDKYVCSDFSAEVNNNAEAQGIRCAIVDMFYPEGYGHTIVAFETTDRGLIFVEPQYDDEVVLIVGKSYSQVNNYIRPPHDDTVRRFLIMW